MRTRIFTLALGGLLALGTTAVALAQDNPSPSPDQNQAAPADGHHGRGMRMDPDRQLARLTRELNLTSDQQAQIKPLLVERQQKMQALFQDQSVASEDRHTQMHSVIEGTNNSIKALLTEEQKQKFAQMQERHRNMHGEGPGGPPPQTPEGSSPQPQN